eukprot:4287996-Ditylum_brightwellii.AAC.1
MADLTSGNSSRIIELIICIAQSLRLYLHGGWAGIIGGSSTAVISISSSSHRIRARCQVGISFVGMGAFSVTGRAGA